MILKKMVLPTIVISGAIFAGFTSFLVQYGSENIEVRIDNQHFFNGEVRDVISPGMVAGLGLTLGLASIVAIGSRKSADRQNNLEKRLLSVKKAISDKDVQIEKLRNDEKIDKLVLIDFHNH